LARPRLIPAAALAVFSTLAVAAAAQQGPSPPPPAMVNDKFAVVDGAWKPTPAEAMRAQTALKAYVDLDAVPSQWADNTPESPGETRLRHGLSSKIDSYWLRATGIAGRQDELAAKINNKPIIRLDGFCKVQGDTWKDGHFVIDDGGGDCYFHADYDLAGKTIVYFEINR
jgi:hypothetical protein